MVSVVSLLCYHAAILVRGTCSSWAH